VADIVPERFVAEGLLDALDAEPLSGARVLVARAAEAREALPEGLRERGAAVDVVSLYDTVAEPLNDAQREALAAATYVTFTSSSTVRFFLEGGAEVADARVVSIGPVTSETLREHSIEPDVEATRHDLDGLVAAIVEDVGR
jgi:uroporphyrinogen III methyltransferase/synthase